MRKLYAFALVGICLICSCTKTTYSTEKYENAEVLQLVYLPDTRVTSPTSGFSTSGNFVFGVTTTGHKEMFGAIFRCQDHGKTFTLIGKENIFDKVKQGQIVKLKYVEKYEDGELVDIETKEVIISK